MPKLLIHMGTNKTGSSYIQRYCANQSDVLKARGILYPDACRHGDTHHPIALGLRGDNTGRFGSGEPYLSMLAKLSAEIRDAQTVILSSEIFWNIDPIHPERLSALFQGFDEVSLLFYIRRQDSFAASYWGSDIKFRMLPEIAPFGQYCRKRSFDFLIDLDRWEADGGGARLIVRPFVSGAWKNENLIQDFLHYVDPCLEPDTGDASIRRNESWPLPSLELLRMINMLEVPSRDKLAGILREIGAEIPVAEGEGLLTREIQQYLLERYAKSNGVLADRYWTPEEKDLFDKQEVKCFDKPYSGLTMDDFATITAHLWSQGQPDRKQKGLSDQRANVLRNAALRIEENDLNFAFLLMSLANELRPAGPVIKQKLEELRQKLCE